jgi:hypothetical protein
VFLTDEVLGGMVDGVARVEGIGPVLLEQVAELLEHREVTVQPDRRTGVDRSGRPATTPTPR